MSSTQVETVSSGADKIKAVAAVLLVMIGLAAYYLLAPKGVRFQWSGLAGSIVLAFVIFLWSESGRSLIGVGRDSWREVRKVVWPTRREAIQTTVFVFVFSVTLALFLWFTDKTIEWVMYDLILGWKK